MACRQRFSPNNLERVQYTKCDASRIVVSTDNEARRHLQIGGLRSRPLHKSVSHRQ